jgi:hypothetical protein
MATTKTFQTLGFHRAQAERNMFTDHFDDYLATASPHHVDSRQLAGKSHGEAGNRVLLAF